MSDRSGQLYQYRDGPWEPVSGIEVEGWVLFVDPLASGAKRREVRELIAVLTYDGDVSWGRCEDHEIACLNGIVNILTGRLRMHSPDNMLPWVLPHCYEPGATSPTWDAAVLTAFGDGENDGRQSALEDFMGYVCTAHARYKKALLLKGGPDTGNSAILHVLQDLVGLRNCCQLSVEWMDDPTKRCVIMGRALNVITELSTAALIADGGFKAFVSTEEPLLMDPKHKTPLMYVPTAKHVIATNNMPRVNDRTEAVYRRLLIILFDREIPEANRDADLRSKFKKEMSGILNVAIRGLKRVVERGGIFIDPPASQIFLDELQDDSNPMRAFMRERAQLTPDGFMPLDDITAAYNQWMGGNKRASTRIVGKMLRDAGWTNIKVKRFRAAEDSPSGPVPLAPKVGLVGVSLLQTSGDSLL